MKWENRDNNVVEQTNIPKFSKLGDKGTPLRLFKVFFDDVFMVIERKQTLDLNRLMKQFAYS